MWNGGNQWSGWISYLSAFKDVYGILKDIHENRFYAYRRLAELSGPRMMHRNFCIISNRPLSIKINSRNQPHNVSGPSHEWRDGTKLYYINGVKVNQKIVMHPESITVSDIESENNAEVRRVMIERYGQGRYIVDSGAKKLHSDDFGTLYKKDMSNEEPIVMVKLINSTQELDGSFKEYFLRVPPTMKRAREAVAWTFGKNEDEYVLEKQS